MATARFRWRRVFPLAPQASPRWRVRTAHRRAKALDPGTSRLAGGVENHPRGRREKQARMRLAARAMLPLAMKTGERRDDGERIADVVVTLLDFILPLHAGGHPRLVRNHDQLELLGQFFQSL